jgi:hypothetical protein
VNVSHEVVAKASIDGKPDATLRRLLTDLVMRHMTDVRGT